MNDSWLMVIEWLIVNGFAGYPLVIGMFHRCYPLWWSLMCWLINVFFWFCWLMNGQWLLNDYNGWLMVIELLIFFFWFCWLMNGFWSFSWIMTFTVCELKNRWPSRVSSLISPGRVCHGLPFMVDPQPSSEGFLEKITSNHSENRYWVSGWWGLPIPLKNDGVTVKVSW